MTTRHSYDTIEAMLDAHLRLYLAGDRSALNEFFADLNDMLTTAPEECHVLETLAVIAASNRDLHLAHRIVRLASGACFSDALLVCARYGWRIGYWTFRGANVARPVKGMTMALAWSMRDPSAYFPCTSLAERAHEAQRVLANEPGSKDDAIDFLQMLGLRACMDFILRLTNEPPGF